jgi:hypothetical protein
MRDTAAGSRTSARGAENRARAARPPRGRAIESESRAPSVGPAVFQEQRRMSSDWPSGLAVGMSLSIGPERPRKTQHALRHGRGLGQLLMGHLNLLPAGESAVQTRWRISDSIGAVSRNNQVRKCVPSGQGPKQMRKALKIWQPPVRSLRTEPLSPRYGCEQSTVPWSRSMSGRSGNSLAVTSGAPLPGARL